MLEISMYINGDWADLTDDCFEVANPADGTILDRVPNGNREVAKQAIEAAAEAFRSWSQTTPYERAAILAKAHALMLERKEELARTMTLEQGKPLRAARNEVQYGADFLSWFAEEAKRIYGHVSKFMDKVDAIR